MRLQGVNDARRVYARVDRRITKERQRIVAAALRKHVAPLAKAYARRSPGKAGGTLAKAVVVRNGRRGVVLLGPRGGKRGAWYRHIFITGAKRHQIGAGRAAEQRVYHSDSRQYRNTGGLFYRNVKARSRKFLYSPEGPFIALGPVTHPGLPSNDFVKDAWQAGGALFNEAVTKALYPEATTK